MNQLAILRRHLCILRQVQPPFLYPTKQKLLERLEEEGLETAPRTFERNKKEIEDYYGLRITYCSQHKGYFLHQPEDEDLSDFNQFLRLLERCERLAFLTHSTDALYTGKYMVLEETESLSSLQHLPILWEALRRQRQMTFQYKAFQADESKTYLVDPLVLLEYRNRWYLAAWDPQDERFKTFGLERMQQPSLTGTTIVRDRRSQFLALKQDALGVFFSPEDEVERVILHINPSLAPYIRTVPIHQSQRILKEEPEGLTLELRIVVNHELQREVLGYAEQVKVLEPKWLREKIKRRIEKLYSFYTQ
jgi:hypothetical protein